MEPLEKMRSKYGKLPFIVLPICFVLDLRLSFAVYNFIDSMMMSLISFPVLFVILVGWGTIMTGMLYGKPALKGAVGQNEYSFHQDRVVKEGIFETRDVAYNDVAIAVHVDDDGFAESFKLVLDDGDSVTLGGVSDPDRAEELLRSSLPSTAEVLERREQNTIDNRLKDNALEVVLAEYEADYQDDPEAPPLMGRLHIRGHDRLFGLECRFESAREDQ